MPNVLNTIKMVALNAVKESKPCEIKFGTVVSTSPLKINMEQKIILEEPCLILTSNVRDEKTIKSGDSVILLRVQGGQKFIVLDRI